MGGGWRKLAHTFSWCCHLGYFELSLFFYYFNVPFMIVPMRVCCSQWNFIVVHAEISAQFSICFKLFFFLHTPNRCIYCLTRRPKRDLPPRGTHSLFLWRMWNNFSTFFFCYIWFFALNKIPIYFIFFSSCMVAFGIENVINLCVEKIWWELTHKDILLW